MNPANLNPAVGMSLLGSTLTAHYGDPEAEYRAMCHECALVDFSFLSFVRARGADHREYLNRRLSQKVDELHDGQTVRATLLGADGRMQGDYELIADGDDTLMTSTPASSAADIATLLDRYVFTEDARFLPESPGRVIVAIVGPKADSALTTLGLPVPPPARMVRGRIASSAILVWRSELAAGSPLIIADAFADSEEARTALADIPRAGFLAFDTIRIETGTPWWGLDLDEKTIPLDANLLTALHFGKGCYPGQETIAKITNLGHPARQLRGIILESQDPPPPRTALTVEGCDAGVITSSSWSPRLQKSIGLAMMKWPYRAPGTNIRCGEVSGTLVKLPFP